MERIQRKIQRILYTSEDLKLDILGYNIQGFKMSHFRVIFKGCK
jgi:hypothetical protein